MCVDCKIEIIDKKHRLRYIDIAKGLLILFVIVGHMKAYSHIYGVDNEAYQIYDLNKVWNGFFMQGFFFITGYCSTFNKRWKDYIYGNIKGIIVPLIMVSLIISIIHLILGFRNNTHLDWERGFLNVSLDYWFLNAIFLAKIVYYPIARLNFFRKFYVSLLLYLVGFCLWKYDLMPEIWYFKHAFMLIPFMAAGEVLRYRALTIKHYLISFFLFFITLLSVLIMDLEPTVIAFDVHLDWNNLVQALIIGTCGSISILGLCKMINKCNILEYIGRNTLVIFMFHFIPLQLFLLKFRPITTENGMIGWCSVFSSIIISSLIFVWILNLKPFKWIIGKY